MNDLIISGELLKDLKLSPSDFMIELAIYLYDKEQLSMGQAKKLAGLTQIEFQRAMKHRGVYLKYDLDDLELDMRNLRKEDK